MTSFRHASRALALTVGAVLLPAAFIQPAHAEDAPGFAGGTISGNLMFSTDYMFRGISNSGNNPQIQGDVTWSHSSGLYVGWWSSNTSFGPGDTSVEWDPYIGFYGTIGDTGISFDIGYWQYFYPGNDATADFDYGEAYAILGYTTGGLTLKGSAIYADNYFGDDFFDEVSGLAYHGIVEYALSMDWTVSARVGEQTFDETSGLPEQDYTYWDAGIAKGWKNITLSVRWHDTNDVQPQLAAPGLADGRVVTSLTFSF